MSSEQPSPQPTPSEQQDRSPIIRLSPPKEALPENLAFNEKLNPIQVNIKVTLPDGKIHEEEFNMAAFILLGQGMYSLKDTPDKAVMLPEVCSTFEHRADIVDLIEKFKLQLYLSSIAKSVSAPA